MKLRPLMFATAMTLFAALMTAVELAAQEQNQQLPRYIVTDLGTLGGTIGTANAVNNRGSVVGFATLPGDAEGHAFLWSKGIKSNLGTLGGPNSSAISLNERGQISGSAETSSPDPLGEDFCTFGTHLVCLPFLWQDGSMTPLPTLGGNNGAASGINNRGQVVGVAENSTPDPSCPSPPVFPFFSVVESKPVVWERGEIQQELPTIGGDPDGFANAINDNGQAVGQTGNCTSVFHAVLWNKGTPTDLGTLGGLLLAPLDINNKGQIVGFASSPDGTVFRAFLWQNGVATDLGTLAPDVFGLAIGINDRGQIVGDSCDIDFACRAFLWQEGTITELNSLVHNPNAPFLENANSINSRGQIAGKTTVQGTQLADAYLATPSRGQAVGENAAPAVTTKTSPRPRVVLPEEIRRVLRQRMGFRDHNPGLGAPKE
jgi:probable HAF family extracellular repeat protein